MADEEGKSCKLFIRHLPSVLTKNDKTSLLKHFGAKDVICMGSKGRMRDSAFAEFKTPLQAEKALSRLHQLEVLGHRLVVQYAKKQHENMAAKQNRRMSPPPPRPEHKKQEEEEEEEEQSRKDDLDNDTRNDQERYEPTFTGVAPKLGLNYPMNPYLTYVYPPPSTAILTNIAHALACVPKFYVQVLHLMNKMHMPAPFGVVTPSPPLSGETSSEMLPPEPCSDHSLSGDESEIESDEEEKKAED